MRLVPACLATALLIGCAASPPREPVRVATTTTSTTTTTTTTSNDALYRTLGGTDGIATVVDLFLARVSKDLRINVFFEGKDMPDIRRLVIEQLCEATGGPCKYSGRSMEEAHSGLNLTDADFDAFVEDLVAAMNDGHVPADAQKQLLGALGPMRPQVVGQ